MAAAGFSSRWHTAKTVFGFAFGDDSFDIRPWVSRVSFKLSALDLGSVPRVLVRGTGFCAGQAIGLYLEE